MSSTLILWVKSRKNNFVSCVGSMLFTKSKFFFFKKRTSHEQSACPSEYHQFPPLDNNIKDLFFKTCRTFKLYHSSWLGLTNITNTISVKG